MPAEEGNSLTVNRDALKQALIRASILSNEKYRGIRVILSADLLKLQAQNPDQEEADVELEIDYQGDGMEVGINVNYMLDVLNTNSYEQVTLMIKDANSSCLIIFPEDDNSRYVIMPMRL